MFCSRSIGVHLLRGIGALVLIGLSLYAIAYRQHYIIVTPALLIGAFLLLRGCPMRWLIGLFETLSNRKARPIPSSRRQPVFKERP